MRLFFLVLSKTKGKVLCQVKVKVTIEAGGHLFLASDSLLLLTVTCFASEVMYGELNNQHFAAIKLKDCGSVSFNYHFLAAYATYNCCVNSHTYSSSTEKAQNFLYKML